VLVNVLPIEVFAATKIAAAFRYAAQTLSFKKAAEVFLCDASGGESFRLKKRLEPVRWGVELFFERHTPK